jgi:hypothetical protein
MADNELSKSVVSVLSHYLVRKSTAPGAYNAPLENLLGQVEGRMSDVFMAEVFARFIDRPASPVEIDALRLYLAREIAHDTDFEQQLRSTLVGQKVSSVKNRKRVGRVLAAISVLAALIADFILGRTTAPEAGAVAAPAPTVTVVQTVPGSAVATTSSTLPSSTSATTTSVEAGVGSATPGIPGDGSSLTKGTPVLLVNLPRPNNDWDFQYGDHDVQLTQFTNSLWNALATCNSSSYRGEQQFRLKNFTRFEAKAVGTDGTADPRLAVKFELFVNDDDVNAKQTVVANPGETKPFAVDLPPGTFAVKIRTSLATASGQPCRSGNAVWGSPYVIAAGH